MQQTFKAKVTNLLQEKLEAQGASDASSDMIESEHSDELFNFLHKTSHNICRGSATKIFKSFMIKSLKYKLVYLLSYSQNDALKNLCIWYIILHCFQAQWSNECSLRGKTYPYLTRGRLFDQRHFTWGAKMLPISKS